IDLGGRTVLPGLVDGHAHMDREGLKSLNPSLAGARSIGEILSIIEREVRKARPGEWIVTMPIGDPPYYWDVPDILAEKRFPNRWDLDQVAPDNPVYIRAIWGFWRHTTPLVSIANSLALRLAGITRETQPPCAGIEIEKDATGEPTGVFYESGFVPTVELSLMSVVPRFTHAQRVAALPESIRAYHAAGTTSVYEEHGASAELIRVYKEVWARGELTMRTSLVIGPDWGALPGASVETLLRDWATFATGAGFGDEWLRIGGVVLYENSTAQAPVLRQAMPYTGWAGYSYGASLPPAQVREAIWAAARQDIRVVTLAGPKFLDVYAEVNREIPIADRRWVIGHISTLTLREIELIARLGVVLTLHTNRYLWKEGQKLLDQLGPAGEQSIVPLKSLVEAGVPFVVVTDNVPVSLFYPLWQAVTRVDRYSGRVIAPEQRISREDALRAATIWGAYLTCEEDVKGSIEPGKYADLIVLDRDYLTVPEAEIKEIEPLLTMVGGRIVHERGELGPPAGAGRGRR
ncbi:MAG: amidohydrolase, partial [Deltaproteobacteria bacterium]|nr:amidohydrolase [Deltaproteobacteria bacterium]